MIGTLCFFRAVHSESFSAGDRKLAEVIAAEISKSLEARFDRITGLLNRSAFEELLEGQLRAISADRSDASDTETGAVLEIDIDQFKLINDACGYPAADRLLRQIGLLIERFAPEDAVCARLGGDEFGVVLPQGDATDFANALRMAIAGSRFVSRERSFEITASIGITELKRGKKLSAVLDEAEIACNAAKELGCNRVCLYHMEDEHFKTRHVEMHWASRIRTALDEDIFELFGQAIYRTDTPYGTPSHFEVLLRLFESADTIISPSIFVPAAERYGFIQRLDRMVVRKALETFAEYHHRGVEAGLSINISGPSVCDDDFRRFVIDAIAETEIAPAALCFELTETAAVANLAQALLFFEDLADIGCSFSLDDFGAGMSSYAYLRKLPVDYVKIDGVFVKDMLSDDFNRSIVESIHQISRASGKRTVAEFVEHPEIATALADIGVDYLQGYALDKPGPLAGKLAALAPLDAATVKRA